MSNGTPNPSPNPVAASQRLVLLAAVGLLLLFVLLGWVLFDPDTFPQKLITFGVAAGLTVWIVSTIDGASRRTLERTRLRMEMQQRVAVAEARAEERGRALDAFLESFVANVNSSIGQFPPHVTYAEPYEIPNSGRNNNNGPPQDTDD